MTTCIYNCFKHARWAPSGQTHMATRNLPTMARSRPPLPPLVQEQKLARPGADSHGTACDCRGVSWGWTLGCVFAHGVRNPDPSHFTQRGQRAHVPRLTEPGPTPVPRASAWTPQERRQRWHTLLRKRTDMEGALLTALGPQVGDGRMGAPGSVTTVAVPCAPSRLRSLLWMSCGSCKLA